MEITITVPSSSDTTMRLVWHDRLRNCSATIFFAFSGFTPKSHAENDVPTIMNWLLPREYPCGDILMFVSPRVYSTTSLLTSFADRNPMSFNCFTTRFPKSLKPGAAKFWKKESVT